MDVCAGVWGGVGVGDIGFVGGYVCECVHMWVVGKDLCGEVCGCVWCLWEYVCGELWVWRCVFGSVCGPPPSNPPLTPPPTATSPYLRGWGQGYPVGKGGSAMHAAPTGVSRAWLHVSTARAAWGQAKYNDWLAPARGPD